MKDPFHRHSPIAIPALALLAGCAIGDNLGTVTGQVSNIECTVARVCTQHGGDDAAHAEQMTHSWHCILDPRDANGIRGYSLELEGLPEEFVNNNVRELSSGKARIAIKDAVISNERLVVSLGAQVDLANATYFRSQGALEEGAATGTSTVLVLRVIAPDAQTSPSKEELADAVFGVAGDPVNLASQYAACSHGDKQFIPASGANIVNGVAEIPIEEIVTGESNWTIQNAVTAAAPAIVGSLTSYDHVMMCIPPGTSSGWIAYAYINHWLSVYNDHWCTYVSAQMHEMGHNLNLAHSGENGSYDDQSGMMGYSYSQDDGPRMCFNAAKSDQLGWYSDREAVFNHQELSAWSGNVIGLADYSESGDNHSVVLSIGRPLTGGETIFMTYNRKKGVNSGTMEAGDLVTIVEAIVGQYSQSKLIAKLGADQSHVIPDFDGTTENLTISVGALQSDGSVDYAMVNVNAGTTCTSDADCDNGLACDGTETCDLVNSVCMPGEPIECDDGFFCNGVETCDEATGQCVAGAPSECDDGLVCNGVETCDEAADQCVSGTPVECDDGLFCNGVESCDEATGACLDGTSPCTDSGDVCQESPTCDEATAQCIPGDMMSDCCGNGVCEVGESCDGIECPEGVSCMACPEDCSSGVTTQGKCGNGICEDGEDCWSCPSDCNVLTKARRSQRFCCVGGPDLPTVKYGVSCAERAECTWNGFACSAEPREVEFCCGDGMCVAPAENASSCFADCSS